MNTEALQKELCKQLCTAVQLNERKDGKIMVSTPFAFPDGDYYSIYLNEIRPGRIRISDGANTVMRLSYDTQDVNKYFVGRQGKLMRQILQEQQVCEDDGNFYLDTSPDRLADAIFRFAQALCEIYGLSHTHSAPTPK